MILNQRSIGTLLIATLALSACFESDEPAKTEIVDRRTDESGQKSLAVSDDDFAALLEKVKVLETKLAELESATTAELTDHSTKLSAHDSSLSAIQLVISDHSSTLTSHSTILLGQATSITSLNTTISGVQADIAAHDSELSALGSGLSDLEQNTEKTLWLYSNGQKTDKRVVTVYDRDDWQEAIVEIEPGVNARYKINMFKTAYLNQAPQPLPSFGSVWYEGPDCTGQAVLPDEYVGYDFGQAGRAGQVLAWVRPGAPSQIGFTYSSGHGGAGCINSGGSTVVRVHQAFTLPISTVTYPNPLTVGP